MCSPDDNPPCYSATGTGSTSDDGASFWGSAGETGGGEPCNSERNPQPGCIETGGDGGGEGGDSSDLSLLNSIQGALDKALSDPNCSKIFGRANLIGSGGPTAQNVLDSLINAANGGPTSPYGSIQFIAPGSDSYAAGVLQTKGADAVTLKNSSGLLGYFLSGPSTIYINNLVLGSSSFNASPGSAELLVLHELGHLLANLGWWGDQIKADGVGPAGNSQKNSDTVQNACGKDLNQ
jgi:hypothetical protein